MSGRPTVLEALQAAIARPLAPLDDSGLTGTGRSLVDALGVSAVALADDLTGHLVPGIVTRAAGGGPFAPLAAQLNHGKSRMQGQRMQDVLGRLGNQVPETLAGLDMGRRGRRE
jgi:hypothetical protein